MQRINKHSLIGFLAVFFSATYFVLFEILPVYIMLLPALLLFIKASYLPVFDYNYAISPLNYFSGIFILNIIISPVFLFTQGSYLTSWIELFNPHFWEYASAGLCFMVVCFLFFLLGVKSVLHSKSGLIKLTEGQLREISRRRFWLGSIGAFMLILLGCSALVIAAGSLSDLLGVLGVRERALEIIDTPGNGRYLICAPGIGVGLAIIFYFCVIRLQLTKGKATFLAWALFLAFSPFFLFSSGRGTFVLPCLLLFSVYCSIYKRPSPTSLSYWFIFVPLFFGFFAIYRQSGDLVTDKGLLQIFSYTLLDSFSRLDVVIASLAGFHETPLSLDLGETYFFGLFQWLPPWLIDFRSYGGTAQLARAVYADPFWSDPSGLATFYGLEAYLAFGLFGALLASLLLGAVAGFLHLQFYRGGIAGIFSFCLTLQIPILAAFQIGVVGVVWGVLFPFSCYWLFVTFLGTFCFPRIRSNVNEE